MQDSTERPVVSVSLMELGIFKVTMKMVSKKQKWKNNKKHTTLETQKAKHQKKE